MKRPIEILALALGALLAQAAFVPAPAAQEEEEPLHSQPFALPLARDARTLAERARGHLEAQRWSEALADLQRMLEEHPADVLPPGWRTSAALPSVYAAHPGAGAWARATLAALPEAAKRVYRERYEPQARLALERAREERSRRALTEIARRYPLTRSAASAWWSLGDVELERGHVATARLAFGRAQALLLDLEQALPEALERRLASVERLTPLEPGAPADGTQSQLASPHGAVPRGDADRWPSSYELANDPLAEENAIDTYHQFPVLDGDRVLVSNAYHMYALDAYTGSLLWQAGPPAGWASLARHQRIDLAEAIAHEDLLLAPAAGSGVVVAALQIPYSINPSDRWQGIEIMEAIPERRLFAFDARSGEEIWSHEPPLYWDSSQSRYAWDESKGSYAERMLVAAPPVLAGARLLVPCYRMSGRIEYHLACYEIETGELLWSTPLVSGQRETNMFGRAGKEFVASPVAVAGGLVIAQTELGAVAALDLLTGEIEWESLYEQLPLPKTISYNPPQRISTWRIAPPCVVGDVVLCTPHDSQHLVAFLLADGRVPWSLNQRAHLPRQGGGDLQFNLLLGAEDDMVYMAGESIAALQKPGGLSSLGSRFDVRWTYPLEGERILSTPRPVLCQDEIVVPLRDGRAVLDKQTGSLQRLKSASWAYQEYGNVLVGDGTLYTLNRGFLSGFFDWEALIERARLRLRAHPDDAEIVSETAELFLRRGLSLSETGEPGRALAALAEARRLLEPQRGDGGDPELDLRLFRVLRCEAAAHAELAAPEPALAALEMARPLAPDASALRDVLLQEERLLRGRDTQRRLAVFAEIERECADLPLPPETLREGPDWLIGESLLDPEDLAGWDQELPVGLWVLLSRADAHARLFDKARALEDLHAALARYGDLFVTSETRVADIVGERIARRLAMDGRGIYEPFERRAAELYERAVKTHDQRLLAELARLYPQAEATAVAQRTRLGWAYTAGDTQLVVELAWAMLSDAPQATPEDALALLRAATLLGRAGNRELETQLIESLAVDQPELVSELPEHEGRTLSELLALRSVDDDGWRAPQARFDASVRPASTVSGDHEFLGALRIPPGADDPDGSLAHVYLRRGSLRAFSSDAPGEFLWPPFELPFTEPTASVALSAERIVAGGRQTLLAVGTDGTLAWRRELEDRIESVSVSAGVALVLAGPRSGPDRLYAFDAHSGLRLWSLTLADPDGGSWQPPVFGGGHAVLFLQRVSQPASVVVVDLVRGRATRFLDLDVTVTPQIQEQAWVAGDTLFVPSFKRRNQEEATLFAYGLDTGSTLWSLPLPSGEVLSATIGCQGRDYLVTVGLSLDGGEEAGGVYLLEDPVNGFFRQVVRFRPGEDPMGIGPGQRRLELDEPLLFLESLVLGASSTPIRAVTLPFGNGWTHTLPVSQEELLQSGMPLPAIAQDCVAIAYVRRNQEGNNDGVRLMFLDRITGIPLDRRDLDMANVSAVELRALGDALFVIASGRAAANRIDILETAR